MRDIEKVLKEKLNIINLNKIDASDLEDICYQEVYYNNSDYIIVVSEENKYIGCIFRKQINERLKEQTFEGMVPRDLATENTACVRENEREEALKLLEEAENGTSIIPIVDEERRITGAFQKTKTFTSHIEERNMGLLRDEILFRQSVVYMDSSYYRNIDKIEYAGFQVYSQNDEDGIIQWILSRLDYPIKNFIEFGVQNYFQSNTRYLHIKDGYAGLIMECNPQCVKYIRSDQRLKNNLTVGEEFITAANINELFLKYGFHRGEEIGILSIDVDGNDYWIWKAINVVSPQVIICEYNTAFGYEKAVTIPYMEYFRMERNFINAYFGVSIKALELLGKEKGYTLVGCNGTNAFFVRNDLAGRFEKKTSEELRRKYDFWSPKYLKKMREKQLYEVIQNKVILVNDFLKNI